MQHKTEHVEYFTFTAAEPGPKLLVFGTIHGDEPCGYLAASKIVDELESGDIILQKGAITLVPKCNEKAFDEHRRFCDEDLNRIFRPSESPESHEANLANELCTLIDQHDILLDIHSTLTPCPAHVFVDYPTKENLDLATALNPAFVIFDWPKVYSNNPFSFPGWTTDYYAHEAGKTGVLIECGQHSNSEVTKIGIDSILRMMKHYGLITQDKQDEEPRTSKSIYMDLIFKKDSNEDSFADSWRHLQKVEQGTTMAVRETGEEVKAPYDGYLLFPKYKAVAGQEWFYFGHIKE